MVAWAGHNDVNEITGIDDPRGWVEPVYDAAGNAAWPRLRRTSMTSGPRAGEETVRNHYTCDARNRMAAVRADDAQNPGQPGTDITKSCVDDYRKTTGY